MRLRCAVGAAERGPIRAVFAFYRLTCSYFPNCAELPFVRLDAAAIHDGARTRKLRHIRADSLYSPAPRRRLLPFLAARSVAQRETRVVPPSHQPGAPSPEVCIVQRQFRQPRQISQNVDCLSHLLFTPMISFRPFDSACGAID